MVRSFLAFEGRYLIFLVQCMAFDGEEPVAAETADPKRARRARITKASVLYVH